jgi:protein O-GlcNAc transferase
MSWPTAWCCRRRTPRCYQPNDRRRAAADRVPGRAECGLPQSAFVFCSFNNHNKIERPVFEAWMRILSAVSGSVLWLLAGAGEAAAGAGVDSARLVFAATRPHDEHLARHANADLFLDTRTCNAHTTASDALWSGLPVLTVPGDAFAGRVASSLLHALGLPELIARDLGDYEGRAVALARDAAALRELRAKLEANRLTAPLFDVKRFARDFEQACESIRAPR